MPSKHTGLSDAIAIGIVLIVFISVTPTDAGCDDVSADCSNTEALHTICPISSLANFCKRSCGLCPVDGQWGPWRKWGNCSSTCGTGVQNRTRMCDSPAPSMGGRDCIGHRSQTQNCSNIPCAVDGHWSSWGPWSTCSSTCSWGGHQRQRLCNNPVPSHGGLNCTGKSLEHSKCWGGKCPVDGQWGDWTNWSTCSKTCGGGQHFRSRSCDNPTPAHGGVNCTGVLSITEDCSTYLCPVNGNWGSWGKWSTCSTSCGGGHRTRTRTCGNPFPAHGGSDCKGNSSESTTCQTNLCPVNGHWSNWGSWAKCSVTCGGGHRYQYRSCNNPAPAHGGSTCSGSRYRSSSCATTHCPPCPSGWLHHGSSCYLISRNKVSWPNAVKVCENRGAWLVEIESSSENSFLKAHLVSGMDYSIGAKGDSRGRYIWNKSHRYVDRSYHDWCSKQPDHWNGENCAVFYRLCGWRWNDEQCVGTQGYVCEKHASI